MELLSFVFVLCALLSPVWAGTYSQVTNFGSNPSGVKMYTYVPSNVAAKPAVIVAIHHCQGTAQSFYQSTPYARYADTYGFVVVYPESPYSGTCWDVSSKATMTRDGGANSNSIANMVKYMINSRNADASKIYVTGASSGAMMTNIMVSTYPDLFQAGIVYAGVPAGCFYTNSVNGWNSQCSGGTFIQTAQQWAQTVFDMYPGYTGTRPRMQIYHGSADTTIRAQNYNETIKQWSGVFGYSAPIKTEPGVPMSQFTRYTYGDRLQGNYGVGIGHGVPNAGLEDLKWFGIVGGGSQPSQTALPTQTAQPTQPTSTASQTVPAPTATGGAGQVQWGQCGGQGWSGPSTCASPFTCKFVNDWYSQCV